MPKPNASGFSVACAQRAYSHAARTARHMQRSGQGLANALQRITTKHAELGSDLRHRITTSSAVQLPLQ
eukprot:1404678-Amphidinium_carterae.1